MVIKVSTTAFKRTGKIEHEKIKIIQLEDFSNLKKGYQKIPNKHILAKLDPHSKPNTKKEESDEEAFANSDIYSSFFDELDDIVDKELIETKQKDRTPSAILQHLRFRLKLKRELMQPKIKNTKKLKI